MSWSMRVRPRAVGLTLSVVLVGPSAAGSPPPAMPSNRTARPPAAAMALRYRPPVAPPLRVVHAFQAPLTTYGAGHRGVDLALAIGQPVLAAGAGRVSFAGSVAGRGVVVVAHPDGISTEYEPVRPQVRAGVSVAAGQPIGILEATGCAGDSCLHWGAKRLGAYLDPMSLLRRLGPVRLLPDH